MVSRYFTSNPIAVKSAKAGERGGRAKIERAQALSEETAARVKKDFNYLTSSRQRQVSTFYIPLDAAVTARTPLVQEGHLRTPADCSANRAHAA